MYVVIYEEVLATIRERAGNGSGCGGQLLGSVLDNGEVVQITGIVETARQGDIVGRWELFEPSCENPQDFLSPLVPKGLMVELSADLQYIKVGVYDDGTYTAADYDVVRLHADFASRLDGLFDTAYLADRVVTVIGLGTGGSIVATELAKNGVGHFRLVDYDRLETHNIARHVCGLHDIGRYKTRALADLLHDKHPAVHVEVHEFDILTDRGRLTRVVEGSDLVVAATDSETSKRLINQICWPRSIPAVYGAAYDRAFGGDVLRVVPPDTPCYECFFKEISELFDTAPKKTIDYSSADPTKVVAEPGLGIDVAFVALILAKMALLTLLRGTRSVLEDLPSNYVMWGNRREWVFEYPLQSLFPDVAVNPTCSVCHREAYLARELGMSEEEALAEGERLLEELRSSSAQDPAVSESLLWQAHSE